MAKKKNWLDHLKKFFGTEVKTKQEKKERRKGWLLRRFKSKCIPALPSQSPQVKTLQEAEEEQSKHAVAVAVATAAAAEAAVAAAHAAAQVVRLTGTPLSYQKSRGAAAAIKIQAAFRGYLARRALKALKGLVRLQALVRGQSVRRQTNITLRNLQSLMKIQSQARASRLKTVEEHQSCESKDDILCKNIGTLKQNSERRWDASSFSKEEINAIMKSRIEAALKRERAMEYASRQGRRNPRRPNTPVAEELESDLLDNKWNWLEQWVGSQPCEKDIHEILPVPSPDPSFSVHRLHVSHSSHREKAEVTQIRSLAPRRSFNRSRRTSLKDDESYMSSPSLPSYMASTASTKSRFRSMSTPRPRLGMADTYSELCFSNTNRLLSPITSIASDAGLSKTGKFPTHYQKSPRIKGPNPPVKSRRSSEYLSFDSECSLLN